MSVENPFGFTLPLSEHKITEDDLLPYGLPLPLDPEGGLIKRPAVIGNYIKTGGEGKITHISQHISAYQTPWAGIVEFVPLGEPNDKSPLFTYTASIRCDDQKSITGNITVGFIPPHGFEGLELIELGCQTLIGGGHRKYIYLKMEHEGVMLHISNSKIFGPEVKSEVKISIYDQILNARNAIYQQVERKMEGWKTAVGWAGGEFGVEMIDESSGTKIKLNIGMDLTTLPVSLTNMKALLDAVFDPQKIRPVLKVWASTRRL